VLTRCEVAASSFVPGGYLEECGASDPLDSFTGCRISAYHRIRVVAAAFSLEEGRGKVVFEGRGGNRGVPRGVRLAHRDIKFTYRIKFLTMQFPSMWF